MNTSLSSPDRCPLLAVLSGADPACKGFKFSICVQANIKITKLNIWIKNLVICLRLGASKPLKSVCFPPFFRSCLRRRSWRWSGAAKSANSCSVSTRIGVGSPPLDSLRGPPPLVMSWLRVFCGRFASQLSKFIGFVKSILYHDS